MSIKRTIIQATLDQLTIDQKVQRGLDEKRVNRIASAFDANALGAITVSLRADGTRVILDGQHRWAAGKTAGHVATVTCVQYEGLSVAEEAELFLTLNNTKQVQAVDKFRVRVISGEAAALDMNNILHKHGWKVAQSTDHWRLSAVGELEKVYKGSGVRKTGGDILAENVVQILTSAWAGQSNSAHAVILGSLGKFLGWYGIDVDHSKIIRELSGFKPMNFVADVKAVKDVEHCDLANAGAKILVNLHNKNRRKNQLEAWQNR